MPAKLSPSQFVQKANEVHNNFYDYSLSEYVNSSTKITIICPIHGKFRQLPSNHYSGKGCPKCKNQKISDRCKHDTPTFIKKAKKVHKNKYDYSKVDYKLDNQKIIIICKEHGEFEQTPRSHLSGNGCPKCAGFNLSFEEFTEQANLLHKNKYTYSDFNYNGKRQKINMYCPVHGKFSQSPSVHLIGSGCRKCGIVERSIKRTSTTNEFIQKAKLIHNDFYDYSETIYIGNKQDVIISCPVHGKFSQSPDNHLAGKNCSKCVGKISKEETEVVDFLKSLNVKVKTTNKKLIAPKELDIVLPDFKIAIEYNGLYWHSSAMSNFNKYYHQEKTKACEKKGYRLIHIFSDDWLFKKEIVKSILKMSIENSKNKVFARKCICKEIDKSAAKVFLNENHIQGHTSSTICLGIFYDSELLQVMAFKKNTETTFTLTRFATKLNWSVIGGASKLFAYFKKNFEFESIITFCDLSMFSGQLYSYLGFEKDSALPIDYSYIFQGIRRHKFGFRRKRLKTLLGKSFDATKSELENTLNNSIYRIYDCGKIKYVYSNKEQ